MTTKAEFNAQEWETIVKAPVMAGIAVVTAERGGSLRESLAISKIYTEARQQHGASELLDEIVASPPPVDRAELGATADLLMVARNLLGEAISLAESKATPDEVESYKRFVLAVADAAANAHKEGGFAGIGGERISEQEQAALDGIRSALR